MTIVVVCKVNSWHAWTGTLACRHGYFVAAVLATGDELFRSGQVQAAVKQYDRAKLLDPKDIRILGRLLQAASHLKASRSNRPTERHGYRLAELPRRATRPVFWPPTDGTRNQTLGSNPVSWSGGVVGSRRNTSSR
jgi:hypothetical protein